MKNRIMTWTVAMIAALSATTSSADISLNLKASLFATSNETLPGPAFWLVWSADSVLGQIYGDLSISGGDVVFYQGHFDSNPAGNFWGLSTNPVEGVVFEDGALGVTNFNTGFLFRFNCPFLSFGNSINVRFIRNSRYFLFSFIYCIYCRLFIFRD